METLRDRQPTPDDFVVLLVEDGPAVRDDARRALEEIDGTFVIEADDVEPAKALIDRYYIDAAVIDLRLPKGKWAGFAVLDKLKERSARTPVVVWSNYLGQSKTATRFVGSSQVIKAADKGQRFDQVIRYIEPLVQEWRERRVKLVKDKFVRELLWNRREKGSYDLRNTKRELGRELDRVCRRLFGSVRGLEKDAEVAITFRPIDREGLSSAVTVEGEVTIGRDVEEEPVRGNRCVVKIGPIKEIEQEFERYELFVKFGVRMAQRVEVLGYARENLIGGIAYSFAGGVFGHWLTSFDQLLKRPDGWHLAAEAIDRLFDPDRKDWYGVHCRKASPRDYMHETYRTDFEWCFDKLVESLEGLQGQFGRSGISLSEPGYAHPGKFSFPGGELTIPPRNVHGANSILPERPACLVHGDMHGGNVMVELGNGDLREPTVPPEPGSLERVDLKRICLIDYRSAGPGPRAVDAVALQASIRLADVAAIEADNSPEGEADDGSEEKKIKGEQLEAAVIDAANRVQSESSWLAKAWNADPDGRSVAREQSAQWAIVSSRLTARMRLTFKDMSLEEYLPIAILCAIRQFGYGIGPLARVRLLAWLSALYSALPEEQV